LLLRAKTKSCSSRSIFASTNKLEKKVEKIKLASRSDAGVFAQSLLYIRRKYKHRGITLISPGDPEWLTIKELSRLATEFCNEFQFSIKLGYRQYLDIAIGMMHNFGLNKIKSLHSAIFNRYESISEIEKDRNPQRTREAHDAFMAIISEKTGGMYDYLGNPDKYKFFGRAAVEAGRLGVPIQTYITAQFAAFDWKSAVPEPSQIYGDKARERVIRYCYENNVELNKRPKVDFKSIKKHGKNKNNRKQPKE
jgi:hypothetical protein